MLAEAKEVDRTDPVDKYLAAAVARAPRATNPALFSFR